MKRLDKYLFDSKLVRSRSLAQEMIEKGLVFVGGKKVTKSGALIDESLPVEQVVVEDDPLMHFVSRGGVKLAGALDCLQIEVAGKTALDVGISTGGFTDCLLQRDIKAVLGVDVGSDQLADSIQSNPRVTAIENFHFNQLNAELVGARDLCVADLSFVSLTMLFPVLKKAVVGPTKLLALVKPQFELSAKALNKSGVVKSENSNLLVKDKVIGSATENGFKVIDYIECDILGGDGNREYFIYAEKQ